MLTILIGTDWVANRNEVLKALADDVKAERGNKIWMVPELISHDAERRLCQAAGATTSRFAEVLSFSRLTKRVAEYAGIIPEECLDNGGRVVAMAAVAKQLRGSLKAYASMETRPEFLSSLIDAVDEFKRCCITADMLMDASKKTEGSFAQKLEELSLIMECYDALCQNGKKDPADQMTLLLDELEECVSGSHDVELQAQRNELIAAMHRFLDSLPDTERRIFLLRYWYLEPIQSIASQYGFSQSKVASMLHRVRGKLRKQLEKEGYI